MLEKKAGNKEYRFSTTQIVALGFFGVIMIGAGLLTLPVSSVDGEATAFIDALFTATTSVCVTGLVTLSTASHWSLFGKIVILFLIQLGGLGVVTCVTLFLVMANRRITLNERVIIRESYGLDTMEGMVKLIKKIVKGTLLIEAIGAFFYCIYFIPEFGFLQGLWKSVFNAISSFCNAGMDILGETSLAKYKNNAGINFNTMALIILGGIGFPVWWDVIHTLKEIKHKRIRKRHFFVRLTLHSKIAIVMTLILIFGGCFTIFLFEYNNPMTMKDLPLMNKLMASLFQAVTTRTAGFFTISQDKFTDASIMISMILMFIGGSPAGTAGGMKTTTIAMILLTTMSFAKGRSETEVFNRKIASDNVRLGLVVVTLGSIVLFTAITLLCVTENTPFLNVAYEAVSALATVGLSRNLTPFLSPFGKLIIIVLMYLGRIGPITLVVALSNKASSKIGIDFPEKKIIVG
ncbi:TrkH family potassium uptake protein [Candidatus Galacturonibacter soehngenii]|nr:potassium transporter TrkG [Candidatus Galacturonibacter soehngenii]